MALYERRRRFASPDRLHIAFPLQVPVTVHMPARAKHGKATDIRYEPGDQLILADTMPNNDPLIVFERKAQFEKDYAPVPFEGMTMAKRGLVREIKITAEVVYADGSTRKCVPLVAQDANGLPWDSLRRLILDTGPDMAQAVAGIDNPRVAVYDEQPKPEVQ